jgi:hypothetical protein
MTAFRQDNRSFGDGAAMYAPLPEETKGWVCHEPDGRRTGHENLGQVYATENAASRVPSCYTAIEKPSLRIRVQVHATCV